MNNIKQILHVLKQLKPKNLDFSGEKQVNDLYEGIVSDELQTDEDIIKAFFSNISSKSESLWSLKDRLTKKLYSAILDSGTKSNSQEALKAYVECYKNFTITQILRAFGARSSAVKLAESTLKKSEQYEFLELTLSLSRILQLHYGVMVGNKKKYQKYNELVIKYNTINQLEITVQNYYVDLLFHFTHSISSNQELQNKAVEYADEVATYIQKWQSYRLNLYAYHIIVTRYQSTNDAYKVIETCQEAIHYFQSLPYPVPYAVIFTFYHNQISSLIQLKDFKQAKQVISFSIELVPKFSYNWTVIIQQQIILHLYERDYQIAFEIFKMSKKQSFEYKWMQERWKIFGAYFHFLAELDKIEVSGRFKLNKFLNELPIYNKDKVGHNINIIIIQILFLLRRKKHGAIIDRTDALKRYSQRHLKQNYLVRSKIFIGMILKLPMGRFKRKNVEEKTQVLKQRLEEHSINQKGSDIEIIPFLDLWNIILELLD